MKKTIYTEKNKRFFFTNAQKEESELIKIKHGLTVDLLEIEHEQSFIDQEEQPKTHYKLTKSIENIQDRIKMIDDIIELKECYKQNKKGEDRK